MNKKGSIYLGISIGLFLFITGVLILPFIADDVTTFRTALNCSSSGTISDGTKITCLLGGGVVPYFIWFFTSMVLGIIIGGTRG